MRIGVCYYPEHWDRRLWNDDARRMADIGIEVVRIGEFAWSKIEPSAGAYEWGWFDDAVKTLTDAGLELIIGTPTATPPKWLIDKYPDVLPWDREGRPRSFGSRRHYCFSSPTYLEESKRIVTAIAQRYGAHDGVIGWQTDNEYGCHDTVRSYSPMARTAFRRWLKARYGDIDSLNAAWGAVFWSQIYDAFDAVDLPNLTVTEPNPSHVLDFYRFSSHQVAAYNKMQAACIRAAAPGRDIYHNFMGFFTDFDHFDVAKDIDVAGWDSYPLGFLDIGPFTDKNKLRFLRQGHPDFAGFHHDLYRSCGNGRLAVLEQQPGPVNWANHNPAPLPGMVRLWTHEALAHGAELLCYFRWRQAPFAQEQMHAGLMRPDNAPAVGHAEASAAVSEITKLAKADSISVENNNAPRIAIVFSYETQWMSEIQPQGGAWDYLRIAFEWYSVARRSGLNIDIVRPGMSLNSYALVLIPSVFHISPDMVAALNDATAPVVFGPRSGSKAETMTIPDGLAPGPLRAFLPVTVSHSESLPARHVERGEFDGETVHGGVWLDHIESTLSPVARRDDGAGLLFRDQQFWLFSTCPDDHFLWLLIKKILSDCGVSTSDLPDGLRIRTNDRCGYAFNYENAETTLSPTCAPTGATFQLGATVLAPAGVACWTDTENSQTKPARKTK